MFDDLELPWKPFGFTLTHKEWEELVTWYVQTFNQQYEDEEDQNGFQLYP
jgi:hypothetical protein